MLVHFLCKILKSFSFHPTCIFMEPIYLRTVLAEGSMRKFDKKLYRFEFLKYMERASVFMASENLLPFCLLCRSIWVLNNSSWYPAKYFDDDSIISHLDRFLVTFCKAVSNSCLLDFCFSWSLLIFLWKASNFLYDADLFRVRMNLLAVIRKVYLVKVTSLLISLSYSIVYIPYRVRHWRT